MRFRLSNSATTCHALNPFGVSRIGPSGPITGTQVRPLATVACSEKLGGWPQNTEGNAQKILCTVVKWARSGQMADDVAVLQRNHSESPDLCVV